MSLARRTSALLLALVVAGWAELDLLAFHSDFLGAPSAAALSPTEAAWAPSATSTPAGHTASHDCAWTATSRPSSADVHTASFAPRPRARTLAFPFVHRDLLTGRTATGLAPPV